MDPVTGWVFGTLIFIVRFGSAIFPLSFAVLALCFVLARARKYDASDQELARSNLFGILGVVMLFAGAFGFQWLLAAVNGAPFQKPTLLSWSREIVAVVVCTTVATAALRFTRKRESKGLQLGLLAGNFGILSLAWILIAAGIHP